TAGLAASHHLVEPRLVGGGVPAEGARVQILGGWFVQKKKAGARLPPFSIVSWLVRVALILGAGRRGRLDDGDLDGLRDRDHHGLRDLGGAAGFGGVELGDDGIARLLDGAYQHHLRVLVRRLDNGDGVVVVVRNDDQGRGYSRDGQHAHRGDRDNAFADPRGQD